MAEESQKTQINPQKDDQKKDDENLPSNIRTDKVTVTVRVVFLKIGEIETVKECFSAEAFIQSKWREPSLDGLIGQSDTLKKIKWTDYWNPKLSVVNALGEPKESIWYTVMHNDKKEAFVCERRRIKSSFLENLELNHFPFDTQDISITIMSERPEKELALEADTTDLSSINVSSFVDEQEWSLFKHVLTTEKTVDRVYEGSSEKHTTLSFTCRARRRIGFFVWNIFFVMFFICSMIFTTFALDYKLTPNRIQLSLILLLTTMTFKYSANQSLPKISYLTYLDYYILSAMVTICFICGWHALFGGVVGSTLEASVAAAADKWALIIFAAIFVGGHIVLFIFLIIVVNQRRNKDQEDEKEYLERSRLLAEKPHAVLVEVGK